MARVASLIEAWKVKQSRDYPDPLDIGDPKIRIVANTGTSLQSILALLREVQVLTRRTWTVTCRDRLGLLASLIEALTMGVMCGLIFLRLGSDLAGIRSREGAMYTASALQGYLILLFETYRLTVDIEVFDRERSEGAVSAAGFMISRRAARFLIEDFPIPFIYSVIFYFMAGFRSDPAQFLTFFGIVLLLHYVAVNLATVCVAVSRNFLSASLIANLCFTLQSLGGGFFVNAQNIAVWLRWTKWTAYAVSTLPQLISCPDRVSRTTDLQLFAQMSSPRSFMDAPSRADRPKTDVSNTQALTSWLRSA
jgi:hypothetical protein